MAELCLAIRPDLILSEASLLPDEDMLEFEELLYSQSTWVELDSVGRIRIPERLLNLAQLESLCGSSCPETRTLATAIAQGPKNSKVLTAEAVMPDAVVTQNLSGEAQISSANSATTAR